MAKQEQVPIAARDGERLAKVMARAGLCSRREAERWITEGRVSVNGKLVTSPALNVSQADRVVVDGRPLPEAGETRLWRYHKPTGLVVSHGDPQGRPTVFEKLPAELPRVVSIGRLDINSEGLLLLTNDGELARTLELPATGWTRRYRVRAYGRADPAALAGLARGITLKGIRYGPIEAKIDSEKGSNLWLTVALGEGKNREVKLVLEHLGLTVNRLIRVAFGPFQLGDLARGGVDEVSRRVLRDQLGQRLGGSLARIPHADRRR
jgi:23S rRNA pseudouridine2605 synthase